MSGNAEACRAHNGWGCFITGENVTKPPEGVFLPVYMDRCEDLTGRPFEHVTCGFSNKIHNDDQIK